MTTAFHTNWSKPFCIRNWREEYHLKDFEILIIMLSALKWRQYNGSIVLYADKISAEEYYNLGIDHIYDLGIEEKLDNIDPKIDSNIFWAASKLYALRDIKGDVAMLDNDFVIWNDIRSSLQNQELVVIHNEKINSKAYPSREFFNFKDDYSFKKEWDFSLPAYNTAFAYFNNDDFKDYYVTEAFKFMKEVKLINDRRSFMVFAEQRLLSMCAHEKDISTKELSKIIELINNNQRLYTHLWGYKNVLLKDSKERKKFCIRCIKRIIKDFPKEITTIANIEILKEYYEEVVETN